MKEQIKEEAERLIERFFKHSKGQTDEARYIHAKQCALICIDEILKNESRGFDYEDCNPITKTNIEHWIQVKQYIEENY